MGYEPLGDKQHEPRKMGDAQPPSNDTATNILHWNPGMTLLLDDADDAHAWSLAMDPIAGYLDFEIGDIWFMVFMCKAGLRVSK